jgi:hypothetical protein
MSTYGQTLVASVGRSVRVSADGKPEVKQGGITIDWSVIAAAGSDSTFDDGFQIKSGEKVLQRGQVMTRITAGEINTATITGAPTGGTFTLTVGGQTTSAIAYNAAASAVQTALVALSTVGTGNATVTGSAGGPYTITFATGLGDITLTASGAGLTGGTTPGVTIATTSAGGRTGLYGPFDSAAVDGRQTLTKGTTFILDNSVKENDLKSDHAGVAIYGGLLWKARVRAHLTTASLANGPLYSDLETALPRVQWCLDA